MPGSVHWAETKMYDPSARFARLEILKVWNEPLGFISQRDVHAEGYDTLAEFLDVFMTINGLTSRRTALNQTVWCVEFRCIEVINV